MTSARSRLPNWREHEVFEFRHGQLTYTVGLGRYGDGRLAEVFLDVGKAGSDVQALARDDAIILSLLLQHNFPIETIRHAITRDRHGAASSAFGALLDVLFGADGAAAPAAPPMVPAGLDLAQQPVAPEMLVSTKTRSEQGGCP